MNTENGRRPELKRFVREAGWGDAQLTALAGDASGRRYFRLSGTNGTAVLMDAPPNANPPQDNFVNIAAWLGKSGFSAPEILAADLPRGFVLCEDLSDRIVAKEIHSGRLDETRAYTAATDMLLVLHQCRPPEGLVTFSPHAMASMIDPVFEYYSPAGSPGNCRRSAIFSVLETVLRDTWLGNPVTILRDCHAENLVWMPERAGIKNIGILDFQDAVIGHPAYDLVSLLFDIRRKVNPALAEELIIRFANKSGLPSDKFRAACAVQSAQRNLRILGVFARLATVYRKPGYLTLQPAVWERLMQDLAHPALAELKRLVLAALPEPAQQAVQS